ncbi:MAG: regulator of sirC expression with transglutaminase-like and TPR domain [Paraglaciecola sp.]
MYKLKQAIADNDLLSAGLWLAYRFSTGEKFDVAHYQSLLSGWVSQAKVTANIVEPDEAAFGRFITFFYVDLAFSGDEKHYFSCQYNLLNQVIDYRTGIPVSLAIIFQSLAQGLGFDVQGVNFPGHFLLRYQVSPNRSLYIDPLNGSFLSPRDLEQFYFSILSEIDDEKMPQEALQPAGCDESVMRLLHNLKASYINEKEFTKALLAVELLVGLSPDDPYERRDRGFLLHQLDCTQVAIADYQYFIRRCPKDPANQLLEAQIRQLVEHPPVVLH